MWAFADSCMVEVEGTELGLGKASRRGHLSRVLKDKVGRGKTRPDLAR